MSIYVYMTYSLYLWRRWLHKRQTMIDSRPAQGVNFFLKCAGIFHCFSLLFGEFLGLAVKICEPEMMHAQLFSEI